MKTISIANRKGGQGKTTISYNLAHLLASGGHRVLLMDMDSQSSLTNIINTEFEYGIYDVFSGKSNLSEATIRISDNLHFIPTDDTLEDIDIELVNTQGRELLLEKILNRVKDDYEFVIIDTTPSVNLALINCLVASDKVIIPVNADYMSYDGLQKFVEVINKVKIDLNPDLELSGIVINSIRNSNHSREIVEILRKNYNVMAELKMSVVVMDSMVEDKPLFGYAAKHPNTKELIKLYEEVTK